MPNKLLLLGGLNFFLATLTKVSNGEHFDHLGQGYQQWKFPQLQLSKVDNVSIFKTLQGINIAPMFLFFQSLVCLCMKHSIIYTIIRPEIHMKKTHEMVAPTRALVGLIFVSIKNCSKYSII